MPVYWIWFAQLKGISLFVKRQLLEKFRDPEEIYLAEVGAFPQDIREALQEKDLTGAMEIERQCSRQNIGIVTYADATYPERLRNIEDPPMVLYFRGQLPHWQAQPLKE